MHFMELNFYHLTTTLAFLYNLIVLCSLNTIGATNDVYVLTSNIFEIFYTRDLQLFLLINTKSIAIFTRLVE